MKDDKNKTNELNKNDECSIWNAFKNWWADKLDIEGVEIKINIKLGNIELFVCPLVIIAGPLIGGLKGFGSFGK